MNAEFHYYALYFICARAGLPEDRARAIAASSQYVDDAVAPYAYVAGGAPGRTTVTQNYAFWDDAVLREVYLPFHFVPRGAAAASDPSVTVAGDGNGGFSRWAALADCPLAKELLVEALRSRDDYRIGVALHAYADGWAHQGFSGRLERGNAIDPASPLPPVGHLQALRSPDDAAGQWEDPRLGPGRREVRNAERFMAAARKIYRYLRASQRLGFEEEELALEPLGRLWAAGGAAESRIADYQIELDVPPYDRRDWLSEAGAPTRGLDSATAGGYDRLAWLASELRGRVGSGEGVELPLASRFEGSSLQSWDRAARAHREAARELFAREGLI